MSDGRLHTNAPQSRWRRRGLFLARNVGVGFAGGIAMWILALLTAAGLSLLAPDMGPRAAAGAWQAAWTPSGFLCAGIVVAGLSAFLTVAVWWAIDQRNGATS